MVYTTIDSIIKGYLLQRGYPIHFYVDFLVYANRCFEEINFDTLQIVQSQKLEVNSYKAVALPCDYLDWVKVSVPDGQFVRPMTQRPGMTSLNNYDAGTKVVHEDTEGGYLYGGYDTINWNSRGEHIGRLYGLNGYGTDTFKYIPEREEIQLDETFDGTHVVLDYISNSNCINPKTKVTPYAKSTIEAFINWKQKENSRAYSDGERMRAQLQFDHQHSILRARRNSMSIDDVKRIFRRNAHGSIK